MTGRQAGSQNVATIQGRVDGLESKLDKIIDFLAGGIPATPIVATTATETPVVETPVVATPVVENPPVVETPVVETSILGNAPEATQTATDPKAFILGTNCQPITVTFPIGCLQAMASQSGNIVYRMLNRTYVKDNFIPAIDQFGVTYTMNNGSPKGMPAIQPTYKDGTGIKEQPWRNHLGQLLLQYLLRRNGQVKHPYLLLI